MIKHARAARGSALVEALLVMSLLIFCAGSMLQLSYYILDAFRVEAAVREGARMVHLSGGQTLSSEYLMNQALDGQLGLDPSGMRVQEVWGIPDFETQQPSKGPGSSFISNGLARLGAVSIRLSYSRPGGVLNPLFETKELSADATVIVGTWKIGI